jgi:hypothetical protein
MLRHPASLLCATQLTLQRAPIARSACSLRGLGIRRSGMSASTAPPRTIRALFAGATPRHKWAGQHAMHRTMNGPLPKGLPACVLCGNCRPCARNHITTAPTFLKQTSATMRSHSAPFAGRWGPPDFPTIVNQPAHKAFPALAVLENLPEIAPLNKAASPQLAETPPP